MVDILGIKRRRCNCGSMLMQYDERGDIILDRVKEAELTDIKFSQEIIDSLVSDAKILKEINIWRINDLCGIDITKAREELIKLNENITQINDKDGRKKIATNLASATNAIRNQLDLCE